MRIKKQSQQKWTDSIVSAVLGVAIVVLVGLLAFNYFRNHRPEAPVDQIQDESIEDQLGEGASTTSLPTTHVVKAGETLWSIAENYYASGFNYVDIAKENKLNDANQIEIGQKLAIPDVPSYNPVARLKITASTYTVIKGDSLWTIALRAYGDPYRWTEIAKLNNLADPSVIHAGNVLKLNR